MEKERRIFFAGAKLRSTSQDIGGEKILEGHAAVFNQTTTIGGAFYEVIRRGAFDGCDMSDVALFVNHDASKIPLARTTSGTLTVTTDEIGLAIRAKLDVENNPDAKALYSSVARGDVKGMSFAFIVAEGGDEWLNLETEMPTRIIHKIARLIEVSSANYPAYDTTEIHARAKNALAIVRRSKKEECREMEIEQAKSNFKMSEIGAQFKLKSNTRFLSPYNFCEARMLTVTPPVGEAENIAVSTLTGKTIAPTFNEVSSLLDSVTYLKLHGGFDFKQPYSKGVGIANYTGEGEDAAEVDNSFGFALIRNAKITAFAELSEEMEKLPNADYANFVFDNIRTAIRKRLTREILFGEGNGSKLTGICSSAATAISPDSDYAISQITDTTLDEILLNYAGEEEVETPPAVLILSKMDLLSFSKVRSSTREKFYQITFDTGNTGRISGVPFILNSALKPISLSAAEGGASSGEYCMVYGNPKNYSLVEFKPLEVVRSDDYKFRSGLACFRGSVICGGNVTRHNGFLRVRRK